MNKKLKNEKERKNKPKSHITLHISNNSGITIVALIITIIVLLILAVVAIRAVQGDGIINHAKNAQTRYEQAQTNEQTILQGQLNVLNNNVPGSGSATGGSSTTVTWTKTSAGELAVGSTVKASNNEEFYVMGIDGEKVILLAAKNVNTNKSSENYNKQDQNAENVRFDDDSSEYEGSEIQSLVEAYVSQFDGVTGRLMELDELLALGAELPGEQNNYTANTEKCQDFVNNSEYWLKSENSGYVYSVLGEVKLLSARNFNDDSRTGVRPVIEISKSSIS